MKIKHFGGRVIIKNLGLVACWFACSGCSALDDHMIDDHIKLNDG